jgi:hypothetical protein
MVSGMIYLTSQIVEIHLTVKIPLQPAVGYSSTLCSNFKGWHQHTDPASLAGFGVN